MANTAPVTQYREEYIAIAEQRQALLRQTVTTESVIKGNTATFLLAGSGGATAVTRGVNGEILPRSDSLTQTSATLVEWHDLNRKSGFNIFQSQSDQRRIMHETSSNVINRRADDDILGALSGATQTTGTPVVASLQWALKPVVALGNQGYELDGNIFAAITPAAHASLMQVKEFTNLEYVDTKRFENTSGYTGKPTMFRWSNITWLVHPRLPGAGTASETCYVWHKNAIGHAIATGDINYTAGYNDEQDYSYTRASIFSGAALLQTSGVIKLMHDGYAISQLS